MHYQHRYHAGNFADVFKHVLLCGLLGALNRKDKPWSYLETHAGAGEYDLGGEAAGRTGEYTDGIARLMGLQNAPAPLDEFLRIVASVNDGPLRHYPGSPRFAQAFMRAQDRLVLCEKVPEIAEELRRNLGRGARAAIHHRDGYEAHGLLPPAEKRGLVLIDPAFEDRREFEAVGDFLVQSLARFSNGIFAAWYPLKNRHEAQRFARRMQRELTRPLQNFEFDNGAPGEGQMRACGLLVVNPPFQFDRGMAPALNILQRELAQGPKPSYQIEWLRPE